MSNTRRAVNFILNVDSYKDQHQRMLKNGTQYLEGNIIARKPSEFATHICSFGIQMFLKEYMAGVQITKEAIDVAEREIKRMGYRYESE